MPQLERLEDAVHCHGYTCWWVHFLDFHRELTGTCLYLLLKGKLHLASSCMLFSSSQHLKVLFVGFCRRLTPWSPQVNFTASAWYFGSVIINILLLLLVWDSSICWSGKILSCLLFGLINVPVFWSHAFVTACVQPSLIRHFDRNEFMHIAGTLWVHCIILLPNDQCICLIEMSSVTFRSEI